ncbi:MAG: hypothetical protein HFF71_02740 [Oscillospiraceae bacterium]|jgi:hypothetical protein|nr:hypothetical protein [Oscillospiraceae bacterium]
MKQDNRKIARISQVVTAVLFCAFLAGFGLLHILLPDRTFSPVENRTLSSMPDFSWSALVDGSYTSRLEKYLEDQFPLRDGWMGLKNRYEYLLGKREFHGVYLCGDRLIHKIEDASRAEQNIAYLQKLTELTDIPVYLGLIPTAAEVYRDQLPAGAENFDQAAYLKKVRESVPDAVWVDMEKWMDGASGVSLFYRTDHHWTSAGAWHGYAALMEAMGEPFEPLGTPETVSENFYGTLYSSSGVHWLAPDTIERYVSGESVTVENFEKGETHGLYVDSFLGEKDKYASFLGGNTPLYIIRNPEAASEEKLLVVRDSYSDAMAPFLSQYFAEIHLVDLRYYRTSVVEYARENGMDRIFVCYSVENFVKDLDAVFMGR